MRATATGVYIYPSGAVTGVKVSNRIPLRGQDGRSFKQQIMDGYKRAEAKGLKINGRPEGIKKIWS